MATKKTAKKVAKKNEKVTRAVATGGDAPAAALAVLPPAPPVQDQEVMQKRQLLNAIANQFNSENHYCVVRACDAPNPYGVRRPTGIMDLDIDLGGGWPAGGLCFVSGPDNAGKSWLLYLTMAMQQKIYGNSCTMAFAPTEGAFAFDTAIKCGMQVEVPDEMIRTWNQWKVQRHLPEYTPEEIAYFKRQVGELYLVRGSSGEEILSVIHKFAETKACSLICVDSIQGLKPLANADKEMDENDKMAAHATMMGKFFDRYIPITTGLNGVNYTTLLMTQQVRHNMKKAEAPSHIAKYLPDFAISGARSTRHYKLVDLIVSNGANIKKDVAGQGKVTTGKVVKWETEKGKAGTHDNLTGEISYYYDIPSGVDLAQTVIDTGLRLGVIQKQANKVVILQADTGHILQDLTMPTMKALKMAIESDFDYEIAIRTEILTAAGKDRCVFR